ncbi:MAG: hypothetical protein COB66_05955 [Coxiella sp. (in: Bacteria)]|nr:MAG: hypothetical protein COB66_05955 [Coxiella sp. (in: g-proteobacteria)]
MKKIFCTIALCLFASTILAANFNFAGKWKGIVYVIKSNGEGSSINTLTLNPVGHGFFRGTNAWSRKTFTCLKRAKDCNIKVEHNRSGYNAVIATITPNDTLIAKKVGAPFLRIVLTPLKGGKTLDYSLEVGTRVILVHGVLHRIK